MKELWVSEGSVKEKWMSMKSALCESTQSCSPCDIDQRGNVQTGSKRAAPY